MKLLKEAFSLHVFWHGVSLAIEGCNTSFPRKLLKEFSQGSYVGYK